MRSQGIALFRQLGIHGPAFTVKDHIGMLLLHRFNDFVNGFGIDQADQIKTETIDVIFICPVIHGVHYVFFDHFTLRCGVIAATGTCRIITHRGNSTEETGYDLVKAKAFGIINMVIDNIHNHADSVIMQTFDHLLKFFYSDFAIVRIGGIRTFRYIVVLRIVSPVEIVILEIILVD